MKQAEPITLKKYTLEEISQRLEANQREVFLNTFKELTKDDRQIRVYADGCFDMFHLGHARLFQQIKNMYPKVYLIIGICSDKDIMHNKGSTVMNDYERIESVKNCKFVDDVIFPAPWTPTIEFIEKNKIDFIAHDTIPYPTKDYDDCYAAFKKQGRFLPTLRTEGISTSDLLIRILKDRQQHYEKILKKGTKKEEINMGNLEYIYIQTKGVLKVLKNCLKDDREVGH